MEVCLSEFSSVRCLTLPRVPQRRACASQWASCSDQLQTEGRSLNGPMGATLREFRGKGGGAWIWFHGFEHTQTQVITPENSYDLGRGSEGEVANSTSSVLLEKLIACKLANKFHRRFITVLAKASHLSLTRATRIESTSSQPISLTLILILSAHLRPRLASSLSFTFPYQNAIRISLILHSKTISAETKAR